VAHFDDPGWLPILRELGWAVIFPWARLSKHYRQRETAAQPLVTARAIFVGIFIAQFLILFVMSFVVTSPDRWSSPGKWGWAAAGVGVASILGVTALRSRPLRASSPDELRTSWTATMFIGIGRANLSEFVALVLTLTSHRLWVFVISLAFTVGGLLLVAPSRGNIERRQSQLGVSSSPLSLRQVLMEPRGRAFQ
jgi:predicted permease